MADFKPKVSIVIPVYNGSNFLREAVDSALAQTYANCEVIVVNDGSDDNGRTEEIARSYGSRIRYISKPNGGVASALNTGIAVMNGEYFSWLSHDDIYYPEKVQVQIDIVSEISKPSVLYGDYEYIDAQGKFISKRIISGNKRSLFRIDMLTEDLVHGCTTLIPRACFDVAGIFDESLRSIQDYDMWCRLSRKYEFVHIPHILLKCRRHKDQGVVTMSGIFEEATCFFIKAFDELTYDNITTLGKDDSSLVLAKAAFKMRLRGYFEVSDSLLDLARKAVGTSVMTSLQVIAIAAICKLLSKRISLGYWRRRMYREADKG